MLGYPTSFLCVALVDVHHSPLPSTRIPSLRISCYFCVSSNVWSLPKLLPVVFNLKALFLAGWVHSLLYHVVLKWEWLFGILGELLFFGLGRLIFSPNSILFFFFFWFWAFPFPRESEWYKPDIETLLSAPMLTEGRVLRMDPKGYLKEGQYFLMWTKQGRWVFPWVTCGERMPPIVEVGVGGGKSPPFALFVSSAGNEWEGHSRPPWGLWFSFFPLQ